MSADVNTFIDKIIADTETKIRTDLKDISSKAKKDFYTKAKEAVMLYYSHYPKPPRVYERTYNLQNNVIEEDVSFITLNGNGYDAWVRFSSRNMDDYVMGNKDVVVSNFMHGIHGNRNIFVESNPAIDLMDDFQMNYKKTLDGYFTKLGYTVK